MPEKFYQNKIYPFQDKILTLVQSSNVDFYLTGGTALSRNYLRHRYSDDLDFFVNHHPEFKNQCKRVIDSLKQSKQNFEITTTADTFVRIIVVLKNIFRLQSDEARSIQS
ncbi:MAG: nucleotidyl transferase AbiEii/AbiGii toxin family protein [Thermodesulfobacteriota bacterium]|nr:nucleotidyl transferase AbiEii/AbiGii toxin family protein [Thermodesulfobacteriota bacterium]